MKPLLTTILLLLLINFSDFYASGADLKWATYFGGTTYATGVATDDSGNVYITGVTEDSTIATSGAYKTNLEKVERNAVNGYYTVFNTFLAKLSSSGALKWCTYFGASSDDELGDGSDTLRSIFLAGNNIATDKNGNVYITGITPDTTGIATAGAYQTKNLGTSAYIAKFRGSGSLAWASYYGANMDAGDYNIPGGAPFPDVGGVSLTSDASGNVYITGSTFSSNGIATKGAFQTSYAGGSTNYGGGGGDAFLAKFDSSGSLAWATYFGGSGYDGGYGVSVDALENIYMAGFTTSKGLASSGAYQTSYAGVSNAFLAKFSSSGNLSWATYFGGANGFGTGVNVDRSGNVYLIGNSSEGIGTAGTYQSSLFAGRSAFLAKFNDSGSRLWATYYGGASKEANSVCIDALGNVFITGFTAVGQAFVASCNPNQSFAGGGGDAYLAEFSNTGYLLYGRYIGGASEDVGLGITLDEKGNIYIAGTTFSANGIATSGAYQTSYSGIVGQNGDAFLAKFSNLLVTDVGISVVQIPKNTICISTQSVTALLKNYGDFVLDSVTINWSVNNTAEPTYHWKGKLLPDSSVSLSLGNYSFTPGKYHIQAQTSMPNGITDSMPCDDSAAYNVTVVANPVPITGKNHGVCIGDTAQLGAYPPVSGLAYLWTSKPTGFTSTISYPVVTPTMASTTYYLTETIKAVGCTGTDSVKIIVNTLPVAITGGNHTICAGSSYGLGATPLNGYTYFWASDPSGFISTKANPVVSPSTDTTVYYLQAFDTITGCNSNPDSAIILLKQAPSLPNAGNDQTVCAGTSVSLGVKAISGNSYKWTSDPAGFGATVSNPTVKPEITTSYYLTQTLTSTGCSKTDSVIIKTNTLPKPDAGKAKSICANQQVSLGYPGSAGDTYQWQSIPTGFSSTMSNVLVAPSLSTIYVLNETDAATGCSNSDSVKVTIVPPPNTPTINGYDLVCGKDTPLNYTVNYDTGSTWKWFVDKGKIKSGQGTNSVSLIFDEGSDTVYVYETNSRGCSSTAAFKPVTRQNPNAHFKVLSDSPVYVFKALDTSEQSYVWTFGDETTGSQYEASHQYTFTKDSLVKVSLTINSAAGCSSVFDTTIDILYFPSNAFNIQVFPNPFDNNAWVHVALTQTAHVSISVYDAIGKFVQKIADEQQSAGSYSYKIDPIGLQWGSGIYFLQVSVNGDIFIKPIIKE